MKRFNSALDLTLAILCGAVVAAILGWPYATFMNWFSNTSSEQGRALLAGTVIALVAIGWWRFGIFTRNAGSAVAFFAGLFLGIGYMFAADAWGVYQCVQGGSKYCISGTSGVILNVTEGGGGIVLAGIGVALLTTLTIRRVRVSDDRLIDLIELTPLVAFGAFVAGLAVDPAGIALKAPRFSYEHPELVPWAALACVGLTCASMLARLSAWDFGKQGRR